MKTIHSSVIYENPLPQLHARHAFFPGLTKTGDGILGCIIDFSEKKRNITEQKLLWQPSTPMLKNAKMAEIFSFLKFGQPSAYLTDDKSVMLTHRCAEDGQYKTIAAKVEL